MQLMLDRFYDYIDRPMKLSARAVLVLLVVPLVFSFLLPIWRIHLIAPQYPDGLYVDIYTYKLEGGDNGQHISEINTLNHYIGMHNIDRASMNDLDWIPFALGFLILMTLRTAAVGDVRSLIDLSVMTLYVSGFAFARFAYKMYTFGHNLKPDAPMKVEPFMPPLFGSKQIANFVSTSLPRWGSALIGLFAIGVLVVTAWHLISGRREALRQLRENGGPTATPPTTHRVATV